MIQSELEVLFIIPVILIGTLVTGLAGFGMGMVVSPFLLLVLEPKQVVVIITTLSFINVAIIGFKGRKNINIGELYPLVLPGLIGVPVGVLALAIISPRYLRIAIAAIILLLSAISLFRKKIPLSKLSLVTVIIGFSSAMLVTGLGVGIPLVAWYLYNQGQSGTVLRLNTAVYYLVVALGAIVIYGFAGLYTADLLLLSLVLLPVSLLGFKLGSKLAGIIGANKLRSVVLSVIIMSGLVMLIREVVPI